MAPLSSRKDKENNKRTHIDPAVIQNIGKQLDTYDSMMAKDELRKAKDKFMDMYQKCEFAYKQILIDYKINHKGEVPDVTLKKAVKGKFNPNNLVINNDQYPKVLEYAGVFADDRLFCTRKEFERANNRSCRLLRNAITHSSSKKAVNEVFDNQKQLFDIMSSFLKQFV